jgi:RNA polymerase sigma factor (sigma-70 family)
VGVSHFTSDSSLDHLIATAQADPADDTVAMNSIIRRFEPLVQTISRSLSTDRHIQEDVAQEARLGLVKAVRAHRLGTSGFASYARRYARGAALRFVGSSTSREVAIDPQDEFWTIPVTTAGPTEITDVFGALTPDQRRVAIARYISNDRVSEIATELGTSPSAVSQRLSTIHRALRPILAAAVAA